MFHEVEGSACVVTSDGMAKSEDVFFFNVIHDHVAKGGTNVSEDVIFVGRETMKSYGFIDLKLGCIRVVGVGNACILRNHVCNFIVECCVEMTSPKKPKSGLFVLGMERA